MLVEWNMSIGYPSSTRAGEVEFDEDELEGKTEEELKEFIETAIWNAAMEYVEVYPTKINGKRV